MDQQVKYSENFRFDIPWTREDSNPVQTFPFPKLTALRHGGSYTEQASDFFKSGRIRIRMPKAFR